MHQTQTHKTIASVTCPICGKEMRANIINQHLDNDCPGEKTSNSNIPGAGLSVVHSKLKSVVSHSPVTRLAPVFNLAQKSKTDSHSSTFVPSKKRSAEDWGHPGRLKRNKANMFEAVGPLAERLRPRVLADFVGQSHLTGSNSFLRQIISSESTGSVILWGPPGCGKTTLARLIASQCEAVFRELSATGVGISEVKAIMEEARGTLQLTGRKTLLFLDEIHRFNRAQQDIFLPYIEQGLVQLIGATTENPSFKLTGALLSRCRQVECKNSLLSGVQIYHRVFILEPLTDEELRSILMKAIEREYTRTEHPAYAKKAGDMETQPVPSPIATSSLCFPHITPKVISSIISLSSGDARIAVSLLELAILSPRDISENSLCEDLKRSVAISYDRSGESHYDMISALHKSIRGSDGSAAMYWLARMLSAGEDPLFIARRLVVCSSEDVGLADNHALPLAVATLQACQQIGMPECRINLAHLVSYLSEAPKSTRSYEAYNRAEEAVKANPSLPVPLQIRNAPTQLTKDLGYGDNYSYNPDYIHPVHNIYMPKQLKGQIFLRTEDDLSGKLWDEDLLKVWEREANGGVEWKGRIER